MAMTLSIIVIQFNRKYGNKVCGILFLYWLLQMICGCVILQARVKYFLAEENIFTVFHLTYSCLFLLLSMLQVILSGFFTDLPKKIPQYALEGKACPEATSCFISQLLFWWFNSMLLVGYKKSLERSDLWLLDDKMTTHYVVSKFETSWNKSAAKYYKFEENKEHQSKSQDKMLDDRSDLKIDIAILPATQPKPHKLRRPSLWIVLAGTFGRTFLFGSFLKLLHDLVMFSSPMLLQALLKFISSPTAPCWHGYSLCVLLFILAFIQSMILHQYFHCCMVVGMNARTAITGAVYKKSLKLSNEARKKSTLGEIVNLMSTDAQKFTELATYLNMLWSAPFQIMVSIYMLYKLLGVSVFAGVIVMVVLIPFNMYIAKKSRMFQTQQMALKDTRVKMMAEILNGIKVLKLYAWELSFQTKILNIRMKELVVLRKMSYLLSASSFLWHCSPFMVSVATFATYVLSSTHNILDAEKAFVSLSLFNILRFPMLMLPSLVAAMVQTSVSVKRLEYFLINEELDDDAVKFVGVADEPAITIESGSFSWDASPGNNKPVIQDINLKVEKGAFVGVVGQVGCGKSTLISAILGETEKVHGSVSINGSIAYVAQQAWIQNASIEENILFGNVMDRAKYNKVLEACALLPDLELLPARDATEVGEQGINLSGGQKQRLNLARAVYSNRDIYLLDDTLSAVDAHVGKHIYDQVLGKNGLLKDKTVIFVTHGLRFLQDFSTIVVLKDGRISEMGTYNELLSNKGAFAEFLRTHIQQEAQDENIKMDEEGKISQEKDNSVLATKHAQNKESIMLTSFSKQKSVVLSSSENKPLMKKDNRKLMTEEKMEKGGVKLAIYKTYMQALSYPIAISVLIFLVLQAVFSISSNFWLSDWIDPDVVMRIGVYGALGLGQSLAVLAGAFILARGALMASNSLHKLLLYKVLRSPMSFFETTPVGRLINVFAKDIDTMDATLPGNFDVLIKCALGVLGTVFVISYNTPLFLLVILPLGVIYFLVQRFYIRTSRQLRRIESTNRSPIFSHFGESVQGASTIRAFNQRERFIHDSERKVDNYTTANYPSIASNRWLAVRLEFIGNCLVLFASLFSVIFRDKVSPGIVGLSVVYALSITQTLNWMIRMSSEAETNIVSVERIKEYTEKESEADWVIESERPKPDWPNRGLIEFKSYSLAYRNMEPVLKAISCLIAPGERVGIVGRTGAGKSSLTIGLFRIIEPHSGCILIDDVDISSIGLHDLRSKLTIIPQDPVLFSGTLRMNLDPFEQYTDDEIWSSLRFAHLSEHINQLKDKLLHEVGEGGINFSVGQRQLLCLARALLRKSKILILDEATAAVDMETDALIQSTISTQFFNCTTLTIAHRINTIMDYSRILVLDKGEVMEFDTPQNLLNKPDGIFRGLALEAGLTQQQPSNSSNSS
ncbi:hypothetical protein HELRODRAFT_105347 [Helobdella robusta]|uniref:ABC-type glutathione-S-conjugate transporter n=1 Tax=Helobdella robusta TaxID=6412 RepID=T1EDT9_HELRO|nr:hypothetical protein HELRODRAFT_105347 [Helobdella robusta]ESO12440.1 hypothetical protein HELRODRAFT_105347 [Helobdella robusta]